MSGDVDTSLGNSLINYALLSGILHECGVHVFDIIVNGDDSVIFSNVPIPTEKFIKIAKKYNMESKAQPSTDNIHTTEFCRTKYVIKPDGTPTMFYNPERAIKIFGMHYRHTEDDDSFLYQTAYANSIMQSNTMIGQYWFQLSEFIASSRDVKTKDLSYLTRDETIRLHEFGPAQEWNEFTQSMYMAWGDEIIYFLNNIHKLLCNGTTPLRFIIDHMAKTITYQS